MNAQRTEGRRSKRCEAREQQGAKETASFHFCSPIGRRDGEGRFNATKLTMALV
jgi:hypothetical protein